MIAEAQAPPLVILGIDVGHPEEIVGWAQQGFLPTIGSLMARGCWGRTAGPEQLCEHGTGLTLFSGISRLEHGRFDLRQLRPGTCDLYSFSPYFSDAAPFWAHLRGRGRKVAIVDANECRIVPGLPGFQLLKWASHEASWPALQPEAAPPEVLRQVRHVFGRRMRFPEFTMNATLVDDTRIYRGLLRRVRKKGALCRHLLAGDRFDLVVVDFAESHPAGHQFWKYRSGGQDDGPTGPLAEALRDIVRATDDEIGRLLAQLPPEANVVVFSLYGIEAGYPTTGLTEDFCRRFGYHASPRPDRASATRPTPLNLARRVLPKRWRVALSRRLPWAVQERLLSDELQRGTDWAETTAFAIPSLYTGYVRVNLRGREPDGIVEPGPEYELLLDRLEADLARLVEPRTGRPAVERVTRTARAFGAGPPTHLPDLFVEWVSVSHFMERVLHPGGALVQSRPSYFRDNRHTFSGFVAASGPSIRRRGPIDDLSLTDLAPTFLSLLGEPSPGVMRGKPLEMLGPQPVS